jgi:hypothetical protein
MKLLFGLSAVVLVAFTAATPDPFTALGGGTCFRGGWFPPGYPLPGGGGGE